SDLHYVVTATNQGPGDATGVSIDDTLPSGVSFGSVTPSQGSCTPNGSVSVHCDLATIAAGASATVDILVAPPVPGTLTDSVAVSSSGSDPNASNDTASAQTPARGAACTDRKSTRLNSSHVSISYAVFCLKKKISTLYI